MADKIQKIREEVERLFNHVKDSNFESDSGAFYYLKDLLDYIDSLQEEPEPQFKVGDTIRSKVWERAVHEIVYMDDSAYFFENGGRVGFADQEQWELVEEPISKEWIEELKTKLNSMSKEDFKKVFDKYAVDFNEESVSEKLEEAVDDYTRKVLERTNCLIGNQPVGEEISKAINFGAKWQKEQLIKEAVDGIARPDDGEIWCDLKSFNFEDGDKCKVILIKED